MTITPSSPSIALGLTQQQTVSGTYSNSTKKDLTSTASWSSATSSVASISASGLVKSLTQGSSVITASSGSISASTDLTVTPAILEMIVVTPSNSAVAAGLSQQFSASSVYSDGSSQPLTGLTWATTNSSLANVNSSGLLTSHHPGTVTVTATSASVQGAAQLTIGPPNLTAIAVSPASASLQLGSSIPDQFAATGTYTDQSTADITSQVDWTVSNTYIANISASGSASPLRSGFTKVTASLNAFSSEAKLTVLSNPRYLYESADFGSEISRLTVNASTGQLRHWGYQLSQIDGVTSVCITTDPSNNYVYVDALVDNPSGYVSEISTFSVDPASGGLTSLGAPSVLSLPISCPQFEPGGNFAYAYAGNSGIPAQIAILAKSSNGMLSTVRSTLMPEVVVGLAIDPLGKFLYVDSESTPETPLASAYGFSIDASTGALTPIAGTPFPLPSVANGIFTFSPSGDYLYNSDSNGNTIVGYSVNRTTGMITAGAASVKPCTGPTSLQVSPDGNLAFTSCGGIYQGYPAPENIISFTVGNNGGLTQAGVSPAYLSPQSLTVDPSGKYLYVISSGANFVQLYPGQYGGVFNSILTYAINPDGTTTELKETVGRSDQQSMILLGGATPVTYSTQSIFITNTTPATTIDPKSNQLKSYTMKKDGSLLSTQSLQTLNAPFSLTTLPWDSDLLLAANQSAPNLQSFSIVGSASLPVTGVSFGVGNNPGGIVIDPSGLEAFASDSSSNLIYWYGNQGVPGKWASIVNFGDTPAAFTAQDGAGPLAMDASGRYLFVANQTANSISEFQYGGPDISPGPYALSTSPLAIATDSTGNLLFMAGKDNMLHMLAIDAIGDLSDEADVHLQGIPTSVAVEPAGHYVYVASSGGLDAFAINQQAGTLKAVPLTLSMSVTNAKGVYVEPSGQYLYVLAPALSVDGIYGFAIGTDGTLAAVSKDSLASLDTATSVAFRSTAQ
jgi:6-phosphogluconolactonase (cycloisomerase 2 family)